jgi:1,4-dihydroxy-2-naphthoate octaprenyltransferase
MLSMSARNLRIWFQAFRPFTYTASMTPVFLAAALVPYLDADARWSLLPLIVIASFCIHAGTNLVSDYHDFLKGVDRPDSFGGSRVLVDRLLRPRQVLLAGLLMFVLTGIIGLFFIRQRGLGILLIGVAGMIGGFFYNATKKWGVNDLAVFLLMGPLMTIGAFFVLTGRYAHTVLWVSLPVGCLVAAILSANNLRDIVTDTQAGIRSTAILLGHRLARWEYSGLTAGAFVVTLALIVARILPLWSFLTFLVFPLAILNIKAALKNPIGQPQQILSLDVKTAKLHLLFGILLMVSLLLESVR